MTDMNLASLEFAAFAGLLLLAYYRIPAKHQWKLLLAAGTLFYLRSGWQYFAFLLFTSLSAFFTVQKMEKNKASFPKPEAKQKNRPILMLCLVLNFGLLFFCKACLLIPGTFLSLGLPLGISFYLFQTAGYTIDVYRGTAREETDFLKFHLFASFFPTLIQGPICRYSQLAPQLFAEHKYDRQTVSFGFQRMLWGYFKKLVIADRIAPAVAVLRGVEDSGAAFFLLTLFYAIQIYADFTGGIDVVLGLSQSLGIELPENFHLPFFSKNIAEYWRRWHISLGEWMKSYIFFPISVSAPMRRLSKFAREKWGDRGKRLPVYIATIVTWAATGIWHGLTPNFLLWGMLNCGMILLSQELAPLYERFHSRFHLKEKKWYDGFQILRMFLLMNLIRACDLFPNPSVYFCRMASLLLNPNFSTLRGVELLSPLDYGILAFGIGLMFTVSCFQNRGISIRRWMWRKGENLRYALLFILFLLVLLMGSYGVGYEASNFIYNQF